VIIQLFSTTGSSSPHPTPPKRNGSVQARLALPLPKRVARDALAAGRAAAPKQITQPVVVSLQPDSSLQASISD